MTTGGESYNEAAFGACLGNVDDFTTMERCLGFTGIGYVIQYNYTALHVAPLLQVLADEAIAREALNNSYFNIECTLDPLPVTSQEESYGHIPCLVSDCCELPVYCRGIWHIRRFRTIEQSKASTNDCWNRAALLLAINLALGCSELPNSVLGDGAADVCLRR